MNLHKYLVILFLLSASLNFSGCSVTGSTSPFVLKMEPVAMAEHMAEIKVASVEMGENATKLVNVRVFACGSFNEQDREVFSQSLSDSISNMPKTQNLQPDKKIHLYVILRNYMLSSSNNSAAAIACIAWAATDAENKLVYHEQFYASDVVRMIGTLGSLKNGLNKNIVRRIIKTAVCLADLSQTASIENVKEENTYLSFEEAASRLPKEMSSLYEKNCISGNSYRTELWKASSQIQWDWSKLPDNINWEQYLSGHKSRG